MEVETKFLRLFRSAALGDRIDGWRVCWLGGWDNCRVVFVVMVEKPRPARTLERLGRPEEAPSARRRIPPGKL